MQWPVGALRWRGARPSRAPHFCSGARGAAPRVTVFRVWSGRRRSGSGHWGVWPPLGHVGVGWHAWNHSGRRTPPCVVIVATFYIIIIKNGDACRSLSYTPKRAVCLAATRECNLG
eukprot:7148392-Prymnesium_polylepis.1